MGGANVRENISLAPQSNAETRTAIIRMSILSTLPRHALTVAFVIITLANLQQITNARIHDLKIQGDGRTVFGIERFGFREGGVVKLEVKSFGMSPVPNGAEINSGFTLLKIDSESDALAALETAEETKKCLLDTEEKILKGSKYIAPSDSQKWRKGWSHEQTIKKSEEGLYQVVFARCKPTGASTTVSFELKATFYNVDSSGSRDYLTAGETSLPTVYFLLSFLFLGMTVFWVYYCRKHNDFVHHVHMMMAVLLMFKAMSLLFHAVSYHFIKVQGQPVGWNVIYYIFAFLKGTMFFVVILLVGTGWSMLKPYLDAKEKQILMIVLPLQVLDNIALVVIEEMSPGSEAWLTWRDVLNLFDIICCCLVLFPIVWQIRHLRIAAATDGKAERNMNKLKQYRNFYIAVVAYIYFTRIIVRLLGASLSYESTYLKTLAGEGATAFFYFMSGKAFRPMSNNPYLRIGTDSDDEGNDDEFGLDDPIELKPQIRKNAVKEGEDDAAVEMGKVESKGDSIDV